MDQENIKYAKLVCVYVDNGETFFQSEKHLTPEIPDDAGKFDANYWSAIITLVFYAFMSLSYGRSPAIG
jgi:hypothetical protein